MIRRLDASKTSVQANTLRQCFTKLIVGQTVAVDALVALVDKYRSGMYDKTKPIGSILELGPTGTGKTAVAEAFVAGLGGDPQRNLMRIDCAEFQHGHEIARLIGSPPGYLGHRETHPFFTNAYVKAARMDVAGEKEVTQFTVVVWDEIEKASDTLWALLLGILDKARLTTGTNEVVDMRQTVHILTSNVGAKDMSDEADIGFTAGRREVTDAKLEDIAVAAARKKFSPEFLNRLDHIIMFKTLTQADVQQILGMQLDITQDRILLDSKTTFEYNVAPAALAQLLKEGYSRRYNARELKRVIEKYVGIPLSRMVASGQIWQNDTVVIDFKDGVWEYHAVGALPLRIGASNGQK
jgi:ATP-dependent Clp protease ATP-binding subunit ClpB